jgi:hypothetical protein
VLELVFELFHPGRNAVEALDHLEGSERREERRKN